MVNWTEEAFADVDDLREKREKSDAYCHEHMLELRAFGRETVARLRSVQAEIEQGSDNSEALQNALATLKEQEATFRRLFALFSVKRAVLSGRIPEESEGEATARCADDAGLFAFLDEMAQIPIGFVDPSAEPVLAN